MIVNYINSLALKTLTLQLSMKYLKIYSNGSGGIRTHISAETGALNQRLRPLGHASTSWRQHPTRHQLYGHLLPITKTIQVRRTRHVGHCWRSRDELISDVAVQMQDDQNEHTFSNYVRIWDVVQKTCLRR